MTGNEIRQTFLEYFKKHHHHLVRSSSLVPQNDPTLLFTNAGMVQFKRVFIGEEKRAYVKAVSSQKCVRAGGKHNDLENVGYTARHHTFFEMLGNFSFGDYFKQKAIEFSWDLLLNGYGLPKDKLWISIYLDDDEAHDIWLKVAGVPEERIVRLGEKDNFWSMGDTGPCGPCSEIHIDRGEEHGCGKPDCQVGCDCDRFLEIWNLVFMQYNQDASGKRTLLPKPSIDTGMGLERIVSVVQDVPTNYETDLFKPIIATVEALSGKKMGQTPSADVAMKVIADHSRAAAFLVNDGVLPSNEGPGYVLRRILRRAIRYGRNIGLNQPFLHRTAATVFDIMHEAYPELSENAAFITNVIENEELRFSETLDHGLKLLSETLDEIRTQGQTEVPGQVIFKLYDTYGFPVDIVKDIVRDEQISLDMDGYHKAMAAQREQSGAATTFTQMAEAFKKISSTGTRIKFVGYNQLQCDTELILLVQNGQELTEAQEGDAIELVTRETPFYAESGGQVGDQGALTTSKATVQIKDTIKDPTGIIIHQGRVTAGKLTKGERVTLAVDPVIRRKTAINHTATHILHKVLRDTLGEHVKQAGSLVAPDRLRFDFTHFSAVDRDVLDCIEMGVNQHIIENVAVDIKEMEMEKAMKTGATALFGEKYGETVRVVSLASFSKEFCGGTHTTRSGDIGYFKIIAESSVAAGVRRIEALTGEAAAQYAQDNVNLLNQLSGLARIKPHDLPDRFAKLMTDHKNFEKEIDRLKAKMATMSTSGSADEFQSVNGVKVLCKKVDIEKPAALRDLADKFKDKIQSGIIVLGAVNGPKALLIVMVTKDLTNQYNAGKIVKEVASIVGGGGGGRPDMAQAGGTQPEKLDQALQQVPQIISSFQS